MVKTFIPTYCRIYSFQQQCENTVHSTWKSTVMVKKYISKLRTLPCPPEYENVSFGNYALYVCARARERPSLTPKHLDEVLTYNFGFLENGANSFH